jgi:3-oxoacyl-[acyl-carrier protein] reductase/pteridine reductase
LSDTLRPLARKTALVTGGAKRIGRAIALELARAGANVSITYANSEKDAKNTAHDVLDCGVKSLAVRCDLGSEASINEAVTAVVDEFGGLDLLVNNAGLFETAPLEQLTLNQWDTMFATNTRGPFLMAKAAHPHLKKSLGTVVNIGSLGGMHAWATHGHYCTSKAALHMLTQVMAKAWAPEIAVNCVAPGMIVMGELDPLYQQFADRTPMQRNGTAADVAAAVRFFATGPHFITGQILAVDGGLGL